MMNHTWNHWLSFWWHSWFCVKKTTDKAMYIHNNGEVVCEKQFMCNLANPLWIPLTGSWQVSRMLYSIKSLDKLPVAPAQWHILYISGDILAMSVDGSRCMNAVKTRIMPLFIFASWWPACTKSPWERVKYLFVKIYAGEVFTLLEDV